MAYKIRSRFCTMSSAIEIRVSEGKENTDTSALPDPPAVYSCTAIPAAAKPY